MLGLLTLKNVDSSSSVVVGVVARSAFELVIIFGINFWMFAGETVSIEDAFGIALLVGIGLFCCIVRQVDHGRNDSAKSSTS
jgi:drug/metabolite transporter (DMT)-like permease